ncbi:MAG: ABC transporter ATP-binding protein [Actinobacteria bacterium]|nr:ABC transporter ATP-binding protein [Actinomycetota bacterium]
MILRRVSLEVPSGSRTALVGPSGAGKTTLLRAIAGLEPIEGGRLDLGGHHLNGVPPHKRRVAFVFQEPRLLPNFDVIDNVAFGLRAAGGRRGERRARAAELLNEVGLAALAGRCVQGLSTGEQQRVALARALCSGPDLLLLDEPLAAVDPNRREGLRRLIVKIQEQRALTTILVTHDRAEAAELGQRVALMLEGRIIQHDEPETLFERPASPAVARFFGTPNLLRGHVIAGLLQVGDLALPVEGADGEAAFVIRPERIRIREQGSLRAEVREAAYLGSHVRLKLHCNQLVLEAHVPSDEAPSVGMEVGVELPEEYLWRLSEATGEPALAEAWDR